jgi:hypothetical protein
LEREREKAEDALFAELQKRAAKGDERALEELRVYMYIYNIFLFLET